MPLTETPRSATINSFTTHSAAGENIPLPQYRAKVAEDMAHRSLLIDHDKFLDRFLPITDDDGLTSVDPEAPNRKTHGNNPFHALKDAAAMSEREIADKFMAVVAESKLTPGLVLKSSQHRPDSLEIDSASKRPDASFFRQKDAPSDGKPHWATQLVSVEFKKTPRSTDPFDDTFRNGGFDARPEGRNKVRAQIITYAETVFAVQHRVALFMFLIMGRKFRVLRWDRSCVISTPLTDYFEEPACLCEYLRRIAHLSDEALGLDPTAVRLSPEDPEYKCMDRAAAKTRSDVDSREGTLTDGVAVGPFVFTHVRHMFAASLKEEWPRYKICVPWKGEVRWFLVGKPHFRAKGMAGRGTRGYIAFDYKTQMFVWLKDAWRASYLGVDKEGDVLATLNAGGVKNVPTLVCHADIGEQETTAHDVWAIRHYPSHSTKGPPSPLGLDPGTSSCPPSPSSYPASSAPSGPPSPSPLPRIPSLSSFPVSSTPSFHTSSSPFLPTSLPHSPASSPHSRASTSSSFSPSGAGKRKYADVDSATAAAAALPSPRMDLDKAESSLRSECPLRQHKHYRLVVEEVALPLKEFQNGIQLVSIILDCLIAHLGATSLPNGGILHRDVSGGNVLICPTVIVDSDGTRRVVWRGVLADWELSKPIVSNEEERRARQPEHTGTWQFTSVKLLTQFGAPVTIPDELEAFFYVLLYYAVRYLKSNCKDVATFIDDFFDAYTLREDRYACGHLKRTTMTMTSRQDKDDRNIYIDEVPLCFNSPLDGLLGDLLLCFRAHYAVMSVEQSRNNEKTSVMSPVDPAQSVAAHSYDIPPYVAAIMAEISDEPAAEGGGAGSRLTPIKEDKDNAHKVSNHSYTFSKMFKARYENKGWMKDDKLPIDGVPHGWMSRRILGPSFRPKATGTTNSKKRRIEQTLDFSQLRSQSRVTEEPPSAPPKPKQTIVGRMRGQQPSKSSPKSIRL